MKGWTPGYHLYQHCTKPELYIEVVTYENDGHFYYKKFTQDTRNDFKLLKIRKASLLQMLTDYEEVE